MLAGALVLAASLTQSAPSTPPADSVRVHFSSPGNKTKAILWAKRPGDAEYSVVCNAPCTADIPKSTPLRTTILGHEDEPTDFTLNGDLGRDIDITTRRGGRGALAGGIVMVGVGGVTALVGLVLTAISLADIPEQSSFRTAGFITLGVGAGLTIGGISLISGRTWEPVVKQRGLDNNRTATAPLPVVATPISFTIAF